MIRKIKNFQPVESVNLTTKRFDIIAKASVRDLKELNTLTTEDIKSTSQVEQTKTAIILN